MGRALDDEQLLVVALQLLEDTLAHVARVGLFAVQDHDGALDLVRELKQVGVCPGNVRGHIPPIGRVARTPWRTELTEYGAVLLNYAQSITELVSKAEEDIKLPERSVAGSVHIAAGETKAMPILAQAMRNTRSKYPGIDFQLHSGTSADLMDGLVRGQYDFLLECELQPHVNLNVLELPLQDRWGIVVPSDHPLATKESVRLEDIASFPLILSRQAQQVGSLRRWFGARAESLEIVATYGLLMNVKWLVKSGFGIALSFEGLIASSAETSPEGLSFVPLDPPVHSGNGLLWRKTMPSRQAQAFLDEVNELCYSAGL